MTKKHKYVVLSFIGGMLVGILYQISISISTYIYQTGYFNNKLAPG